MNFTEYMKNSTFSVTANSIEPFAMEAVGERKRGGPREKTGAIVQQNGDVLFRMYAPDAEEVHVTILAYIGEVRGLTIPLENHNGMWEGCLKYDGNEVGPKDYAFYVDGGLVINPNAPVYFRYFRMCNYFELPDPEFDLHFVKDVPHGTIAYRIFWSKVFDEFKRCLVYLPAEYESNPDKKYPVLWLNNGGSENETTWTYAGKVPQIMDNLIAEGKAVPMIVVMCNTMVRLPEEAQRGRGELYGWRDMILCDCMPFIESEYRTVIDKWHRAMAGNSMGGMATSFAGFEHPELFSYLGLFSTSLRSHDFHETFEENTQLHWMIGNKEKVREEYKLLFRSTGDLEAKRSKWKHDDDEWLHEQGIDELPNYKSVIYESGFEHDWATFRRALADFVKLIFKD